MSVLAHHPRTGTALKALLTLVLVTAVVAAGAGLAAYAVAQVVVSLLS